ncbi:isoleucine--tRNA ligase [Halobacteriales archaeon QS_8_69_26]|nr:MAG: isoleucine--tRNA ligase [Halobacteriales archaeon QS_8_69_26]
MSQSDESGGRRDRFAEVADRYDPDAVEERAFDHWEAVDAYEKTTEHRSDGEDYFFVDGPPYTSGAAHMGTTWNKALKDAYIRYLRMQGYDVTDRPGYDMHGLPIETEVEERLGFEDKKDIEEFGVENFIDECTDFAEEQLDGLQEDFKSFGVWMDWDDPYKTVSPEYMEAAWWAFKQVDERGLVEQGQRSITQCPRCETAIAKNEVEYHQVEDPSIYVKFQLKDREGSLVIWTTTPWTVPGNTFVAVGKDMTYQAVRARKDGESEVLYLEESTVEEVLKKGRYDDYEVVEEFEGDEMVGWEYEHPLGDLVDHPGGEHAVQVYVADYVEADRTGLVHSAPGHGEEDFERGTELGLDVFCPVGGDGVYDDRAGPYAGQFVRDANPQIMDDLEERGLMLARETVTHDYGQCWRCDTDIVQIVTDQWFINVTDVKADLLVNLEDSEWYPPGARDNRFRNFVEEAPDWNVSRQRYWGIPIPIWIPDESVEGQEWSGDMDDAIVIGTREELAERVDQDVDPESVDLHKPSVDPLTITEDGVTYTRVPDVFDVWLDSSVATWGTLDYPEEEAAFEGLWPADLIIEAHDQTRGWFWSQLGMGTAAMNEVPYERVLMHGWVNDAKGEKMSKSVGNVVTPGEAIDRQGVDVMRTYLLSVNPQGEDLNFTWDEMDTVRRQFNTLWNTFRFPMPYMRMDGFDPGVAPEAQRGEGDLELVDEWVLSRLQTVELEMTDHWGGFRHDRALDALLEFVVEDVSRFYVQAVRERMWAEEDTASKRAAYTTLYAVLYDVVALLAPYAPLLAEELYGVLVGEDGHDTVHMRDWPEPAEELRDPDLERDVEFLRAVEAGGRNARDQAGRGLRWPVPRIVVAAGDEGVADAVEAHRDLLSERLNAREVELIRPEDRWEELSYSAEADMSLLGPAFGGRAQEVMRALNEAEVDEPSLEALAAAVNERLDDPVELDAEMVEFVTNTPEEVAAASFDLNGDERGVVYVDASLTEDIESEGYAREVIRRVQEMRNDLDLEMDAEIRLQYDVDDDRVADLVAEHEALIREETRAAELGAVDGDRGARREWDIEGVTVEIALEPLATEAA